MLSLNLWDLGPSQSNSSLTPFRRHPSQMDSKSIEERKKKLQEEMDALDAEMAEAKVAEAKDEAPASEAAVDAKEEKEDDAKEEGGEPDWEGDVDTKVEGWKAEGNKAFSANDYDAAVKSYTRCVNALKKADKPPIASILGNRSASYLALKRWVPASWDAQCAVEADSTWWKGHWRHGVALMSMAPRMERSQQAVNAFERCAACDGLSAEKKEEVAVALERAKVRLQDGKDRTPMPPQCQQS
jgi:tetratricopeptide (TPR) repeat protein